jgi:hypothetical protein
MPGYIPESRANLSASRECFITLQAGSQFGNIGRSPLCQDKFLFDGKESCIESLLLLELFLFPFSMLLILHANHKFFQYGAFLANPF